MNENKYTFEEIGKLIGKRNILGTAVAFDDEEGVLKGIQGAINTGARLIEIASLGRHGAARNFGFSSSLISEVRRTTKFNNLNINVHVSPYINIAGFDNRGFSLELRSQAVREAKAAIDFAYAIDAGVLVLHPNSFPRSLSDIDSEVFSEGAIRAYYLVDPRNEQIIAALSEQDAVFIPEQAKDRSDPLWLLDRNRQPLLDSLSRKPIPRLATDANGRIRSEEVSFAEFIRREKKQGKSLNEIVKDFLYLQRAGEVNRVYLSLVHAERALSEAQERRDRLQETLSYYRTLNGTLSSEERWRLERSIQDSLSSRGISVPADIRSVVSLLEDELQANQHIIEASRQSIAQGWPQLSQVIEGLREIRLLEEHGLEVIAEAIAELGEYCLSKDEAKPICLTIENLALPQMFGSNASELLQIIDTSRKKLTLRLQERGYGSSESKRLARELIGATLDIGHLNSYRQYYHGDSFNKWMVSEARDLSKSGAIYNLHLSDNCGDDSHLLLGEGNVPIKELLTVLVNDDYKGYVVVEGTGSPGVIKHAFNLLGVLPRATDDELQRGFTPRQALYGLKWKDDPERPRFGREDD